MRVISAHNVCEALPLGLDHLSHWGEWQDSRNGQVLVSPVPVTTTYIDPMQRVLFSPVRDANPFFHLGEAMWMLAGRQDAKFLDLFVKDFSERFAEPNTHGSLQHGAYGYRWRKWFGDEEALDQLETVIMLLKKNPDDRRVVLNMWDPAADLNVDKKDIPCNTHAYLRVRQKQYLDLTVLCRSNDIVWGAYGANAVHFAFLLEYLAAMSGYSPGAMYQVSNNFHIYETIYRKLLEKSGAAALSDNRYRTQGLEWTPLVGDPETFDSDLEEVLRGGVLGDAPHIRNPFLSGTVAPMLAAMRKWRDGEKQQAAALVAKMQADDWRIACGEWVQRRM